VSYGTKGLAPYLEKEHAGTQGEMPAPGQAK